MILFLNYINFNTVSIILICLHTYKNHSKDAHLELEEPVLSLIFGSVKNSYCSYSLTIFFNVLAECINIICVNVDTLDDITSKSRGLWAIRWSDDQILHDRLIYYRKNRSQTSTLQGFIIEIDFAYSLYNIC